MLDQLNGLHRVKAELGKGLLEIERLRWDAQPLGPGLAPGNAGLTLVIGNENAGVDPAVLALADRIVCLPMRGVKRSLNVATAFGAAIYLITEAILAAPATSADDAAHH